MTMSKLLGKKVIVHFTDEKQIESILDIVVDGKNRMLFNLENVDKLARQMNNMMGSDEHRENVLKEPLSLAKGIFSIGELTEKLGHIYRSIISC